MPTPNYKLSNEAVADIHVIGNDSCLTFGLTQTLKYHLGLESRFELLAQFPRVSLTSYDLRPGLYHYPYKRTQYSSRLKPITRTSFACFIPALTSSATFKISRQATIGFEKNNCSAALSASIGKARFAASARWEAHAARGVATPMLSCTVVPASLQNTRKLAGFNITDSLPAIASFYLFNYIYYPVSPLYSR